MRWQFRGGSVWGMLKSLIRSWCARHGLKRADLAARLGVSTSSLTQWVAGVTVPRPDAAHRVAAELGCDPVELLASLEARWTERRGRGRHA